MKNSLLRYSGLKSRLYLLKNKRAADPIWKLDKSQQEYLANLGFPIMPWIYRIKTKAFRNIHNIPHSLIKDIHYAYKRGRKELFIKLKRDEMRLLEEYGVYVLPYKYKIILNP